VIQSAIKQIETSHDAEITVVPAFTERSVWRGVGDGWLHLQGSKRGTRSWPAARQVGGSQAPRRRSLDPVNPDHGRRNHPTMFPDMRGIGLEATTMISADE